MHVTRLIDPRLWDSAGWIGVSFFFDAHASLPPVLALMFRHQTAGGAVFADLIKKTGPDDPSGLLRVAVIEGDIPGKAPGYTVHIGPYMDNATDEAKAAAGKALEIEVALVSRVCRMGNHSGGGLSIFKERFARFRRYRLVPAGPTPDTVAPGSDLGIWKTELVFRQAASIARTGPDQDHVVL